MEIRNETIYKNELVAIFNKIQTRKIVLVLLVFVAVFTFFITVMFIEGEIGTANLFLGFTLAYVLFICVVLLKTSQLRKRERAMHGESSKEYTFMITGIKIESKTPMSSSSGIYSYDMISLVILREKIIVFYFNNMHAHIVDPNGFVSRTREEFVSMIMGKIDSEKIKGYKNTK